MTLAASILLCTDSTLLKECERVEDFGKLDDNSYICPIYDYSLGGLYFVDHSSISGNSGVYFFLLPCFLLYPKLLIKGDNWDITTLYAISFLLEILY